MKRWVIGLVVVAGISGAAWQLRPERFAVNAPLRQLLLGRGGPAPDSETLGARIEVPTGFSISIWARDLTSPRFLRFTPAGDLLVSLPRKGRVTLLEADADGDGESDGRRVLLSGLDRPHGLDIRDGWLYVGETGAVVRAAFDAQTRRISSPVEPVVRGLPSGGNHWTRTVRFGPDGLLYVSIGSDCNVCIEKDPRRAALLRYQPDGTGEEIHATGLRNSVGFDWQPGTGHLYATDNGRDLLGDDFPPCELNLVEAGSFYGWPFANGNRIPDPDFGEGRDAEIAASIPPAHGFRAHNAPLGMTFVRGNSVPDDYRGAALVALHGSWNRSQKDGYRVVSLHWTPTGIEERPFASGFLREGDVIGRPVDVAEGPDGAFYVSDDYAGAIYRIAWVGAGARSSIALAPSSRTVGNGLAGLEPAARARRAERGEALYRQHSCAPCHEAAAAEAGTVVKELERLGERHDLAGLEAFLAAPTPPMPVPPLSDDERRDLAVHLLSTHP